MVMVLWYMHGDDSMMLWYIDYKHYWLSWCMIWLHVMVHTWGLVYLVMRLRLGDIKEHARGMCVWDLVYELRQIVECMVHVGWGLLGETHCWFISWFIGIWCIRWYGIWFVHGMVLIYMVDVHGRCTWYGTW